VNGGGKKGISPATKPVTMTSMTSQDPEDIFIRNLLISASTLAVLALLTVAMAATVLVSANFNVLEWME
jgi:hypothetical protein